MSTAYLILKYIHISTVAISFLGFIVRGIWMIQSSTLLQQRWVKIAPHINDTILLLTAIALVVITAQYPGANSWINAKILALVLYIILGTIALKRGETKKVRIVSWCIALLTFTYIILVAIYKNPVPIYGS